MRWLGQFRPGGAVDTVYSACCVRCVAMPVGARVAERLRAAAGIPRETVGYGTFGGAQARARRTSFFNIYEYAFRRR